MAAKQLMSSLAALLGVQRSDGGLGTPARLPAAQMHRNHPAQFSALHFKSDFSKVLSSELVR